MGTPQTKAMMHSFKLQTNKFVTESVCGRSVSQLNMQISLLTSLMTLKDTLMQANHH